MQRWDSLRADAALWLKRPHVAEVHIAFNSCGKGAPDPFIPEIPTSKIYPAFQSSMM